jgi:hypothetical protein
MKTVPLSKGLFALVDDEDYELVIQYKWHESGRYAMSWKYGPNGYQKHFSMHRLILGVRQGVIIDHINGNEFDNRKENLRICTTAQNAMNKKRSSSNTSGYKGVSFDKKRNKYCSAIKYSGKTINLGRYKTAIEAHEVYKQAAIKYFGEFARFE